MGKKNKHKMLRERHQSLSPSPSHLPQVKATKTAWQISTDYHDKVLAHCPCHYCQSRKNVKNYFEQWRYMYTEMIIKDDKREDFDRLRYYSAFPVHLFNFQDSVDSGAKQQQICVMQRLVTRQRIYMLPCELKQNKGKRNDKEEKKGKSK